MNGYPFNNPDLQSFYGGGQASRPFGNRGLSGNLPRSMPAYYRPSYLHGLGDVTSTDPSDTSGPSYTDTGTPNMVNNQDSIPVPFIDTSGAGGSNMTTIAQDTSSLVNSIRSGAQGILQFEAAQNAINAQRNLTTALTPGMITLLILAGVAWMVTKK